MTLTKLLILQLIISCISGILASINYNIFIKYSKNKRGKRRQQRKVKMFYQYRFLKLSVICLVVFLSCDILYFDHINSKYIKPNKVVDLRIIELQKPLSLKDLRNLEKQDKSLTIKTTKGNLEVTKLKIENLSKLYSYNSSLEVRLEYYDLDKNKDKIPFEDFYNLLTKDKKLIVLSGKE